MDTRQFRNLITIFEMGSLGKAAEALHISQPALTKSIQRLEERLGVQLFYRDAKGMRPTIYGEALRAHAQEITVGVNQAVLDIEALKAGSDGTIRVAAGPLMTNEILANAIVLLMAERPRLRVNIHTEIGDATPDLLLGKHDFILTLLPVGELPRGLVQKPIFNDRIAVIAQRQHPLASKKRVKVSELLDYGWVLPEPEHYHRKRLESVFESENLSLPRAVVECSSTNFIKSVVRQTHHLGLIAKMGVSTDPIVDHDVVEIAIDSPFMVRPIGIVWRERHVLTQSSRFLIQAISRVCEDMQKSAADRRSPAYVQNHSYRAPPKRHERNLKLQLSN